MSNNTQTLRDYFAAKALPISYQYWMHDFYLPGYIDSELRAEGPRHGFERSVMELIAEEAYEMADAMMEARNAAQ
jgi:hypothetical protein